MRRPGDDGYRTPTIEDAERELVRKDANVFLPPAERRARDVHTSALEALHNPSYRVSEGTSAKDYAPGKEEDQEEPGISRSHIKCSESHSMNLSWKERIRHFTWAYFTLTMATGGIANVLYTGKLSPYVFRSHANKG